MSRISRTLLLIACLGLFSVAAASAQSERYQEGGKNDETKAIKLNSSKSNADRKRGPSAAAAKTNLNSSRSNAARSSGHATEKDRLRSKGDNTNN